MTVTTVGQPTENTPDMYSLIDTTEKVVDEKVVDETLLVSQRNIDSRLTSVDLRVANAPPRMRWKMRKNLVFGCK